MGLPELGEEISPPGEKQIEQICRVFTDRGLEILCEGKTYRPEP
jgi:hypothetical protein